MNLLNRQKAHVQKLTASLRVRRLMFDLSPTGTGKTICALYVAKNLHLNPVVICPLAAIPGWKRHADLLGMPLTVVNYESVQKSKGFVTAKGIQIPKDSLVIYDECHRAKNYKTQNTKTMIRISRAGYKILALSATLAHHAEHLRGWNEAVRLTNDYSFSSFMFRCGYYYEKNRWGGTWLPQPQALEKTAAVLAPWSSAMTLEGLPDVSLFVEVVKTKEDAELSKLYETTFKKLRAGDKQKGDHLVEILRVRQASERTKIAYLVEQIEELIEEGRSVVVFCNFNDSIDLLAGELAKYEPAQIRGGQNPRVREVERLKFQQNKTPVILCNLQSGGVALDLHDLHGRPRYSFILPSWSAVDLKQAIGRTRRTGALSKAVCRILYSDVPTERRLAEAVENKIEALDTLHDSETDFTKLG